MARLVQGGHAGGLPRGVPRQRGRGGILPLSGGLGECPAFLGPISLQMAQTVSYLFCLPSSKLARLTGASDVPRDTNSREYHIYFGGHPSNPKPGHPTPAPSGIHRRVNDS